MQIILKRQRQYGEILEGQLFIDGLCICDTLENERCRLPSGSYSIGLCKCHQYSRKVLFIKVREAPPCTCCPKLPAVNSNTILPGYCPRLAVGNGIHNRRDGTILLGRRATYGLLLHSKDTFGIIYERIRKNAERGNDIVLIIQ